MDGHTGGKLQTRCFAFSIGGLLSSADGFITNYTGSLMSVFLLVCKEKAEGFPEGTMVYNPPTSAEDTGWIPRPRKSHAPWGNKAHACTTTPEACTP